MQTTYKESLANKSGYFRTNYNNQIAFAKKIDAEGLLFNLKLRGGKTAEKVKREELIFFVHFLNHKTA